MNRLLIVTAIAAAACCSPFVANSETKTERFSDVPKDHWAAQSVMEMTDKGVIQGYPDNTYRGDRTVTRYELAVALARFAELMQSSKKPLTPRDKITQGSLKSDCPKWAKKSLDKLVQGQYLQNNSSLITGGHSSVTEKELANALASVSAKIIELDTTASGPTDKD